MLKPLGNRIVVEKYVEPEEEEKTESGLILSKKKVSTMAASKVVAVGAGLDEKLKEIVTGCTVYYNKSTAFEPYRENDKTYYILEAKEVLGIVED